MPAIGAVVALHRRGARQARRCQVGVCGRLLANLGRDVRLPPWGILVARCTLLACGRTVARNPRRAGKNIHALWVGRAGPA